MRKAGGSAILKIYDHWLRENNCFKYDTIKLSIAGMRRGVALQPNHNVSVLARGPCANTNILHNEFNVIDGIALSSVLPRTDRRRNGVNISFFTTFRNPLHRLCSQAFFGSADIAYSAYKSVGASVCSEVIPRPDIVHLYKNCPHLRRHSRWNCSCMITAYQEAISKLRSTPALWYEWMDVKPSYVSGDHYIANYYTKRLMGLEQLRRENSSMAVDTARWCLARDMHCPAGTDDYNVLSTLVVGTAIASKDTDFVNATQVLEVSKRLVSEQLDFILVGEEQVSVGATIAAIKSSMFGVYAPSPDYFRSRVNEGHLSVMNVSYDSLIPAPVLSRMREENALDIALYEHAVRVFRERTHSEGWEAP